jgi:hypothetical protein
MATHIEKQGNGMTIIPWWELLGLPPAEAGERGERF